MAESQAGPAQLRARKQAERAEGNDSSSQKADNTKSAEQRHPRPSILLTVLGVATVFGLASCLLYLLTAAMPDMPEDERQYLRLPFQLEDAQNLARVITKYRDDYALHTVLLWFSTFVFCQTFLIPATIPLCILSGAIFEPQWYALILVCAASAFGATGSYTMSRLFGRALVQHYLPERCRQWRQTVDKNRNNLLFFMIFLRATPFLPNWFINIASPVIGVDFFNFWLGTFIGVAPPCMLYVQAGSIIQQLTSTREAIPVSSMITIAAFGFLALLPIVFKERLKKKFI